MAQKSIPTLNKVGLSMFWNNMWDDKINFAKNLHKSLFLKDILNIIINNKNSQNIIKSNKKYFYKNTFFNSNIFKSKNIFLDLNSKFNKNQIELYFSKIWILKIHNWIIIYIFFISNNSKNIKFTKNNKNNHYNFKKLNNLFLNTNFF